tara:strand:- start:313 stop:687 length:375 start_codon:yes stop_codon:yes gene_type:complete
LADTPKFFLPSLTRSGLGTGVIPTFPDPKMAEFTPFWNNVFGTSMDYKPFFLFIGISKMMGVITLWANDSKFGTLLLLAPTLSALYMHHMMGDPILPAVVMGAMCAVLLGTEAGKKGKLAAKKA